MSDVKITNKAFTQDGFSVASLKTQIKVGDVVQKGLNSNTLQTAIHQSLHQGKSPDPAPIKTSDGDTK